MTYRGVYRDGIVVLRGAVDLRNGQPVDVKSTGSSSVKSNASAKAKSAVGGARGAKGRAKSRKPAKPKSAKHPLPGFGAWKHRTDIVDSAEFARWLRRRTSTRFSAD